MDSPNRHNGGPLNDDDARKLWDHVRALEVLAEQKAEIGEDEKARKSLAKADGFDPNIIAAILKRRKLGAGETRVADDLVRLYEEALEDQGALPLESTRRPTRTPEDRRSVEEVAQSLHGEEPPPLVRRPPSSVQEAADALDRTARAAGATISMSVGDGESVIIAGEGRGSVLHTDPF